MSDSSVRNNRPWYNRLFLGDSSPSSPASEGNVEARKDGKPNELKGPASSQAPGASPGVGASPTRFEKPEEKRPPPPPPPRLLGDLPQDTPIARTDRTRQSGFAPPTEPRIFLGAQVRKEGGGVEGTLVGYTSGGGFVVRDAQGQDSRVGRIEVKPGQQFVSVAETLPAAKVYKVSGDVKKGLDGLLAHGVGSGKSTVGDVVGAIRGAGFEAFIAGGAVRDLLQGKAPRDVDLATTMWIREANRAMSRAGISTGFVNSQYGVMIVGRGGSNGLDVCSFKSGSGFGFDITDDIKSRDFTINAMFYDAANGVILDPTGRGVADAKAMHLRPACEPGKEAQWLRDNPSAVLRFLKFTLRGYSFDPSLLKLVQDNFASCVRGMDGLRRSRQLDSVYGGPGREEKLTAEMKRLGFPESSIEALFPPRRFFSGFGRKDDDDDGPSFPSMRGSSGPSWSSGPSSSGPSSSGPSSSGPSRPSSFGTAGYIGPSTRAVQEYAKAKKLDVVDYGPRYSNSAAARLGAVPPDESAAWGQLFPNGWKKKSDGEWRHNDGSFVHFIQGNVFRGVDGKVFAGRPPDAPRRSGGAGGSGGAAVSSPSSPSSSPASNASGPSAPSGPSGGAPVQSAPSGLPPGHISRLLQAEPSLRTTRPERGKHAGLAVATGHLDRLPSQEHQAMDELRKKGFQLKNNRWEHADGSWVKFFEGNVFRGHNNDVFTAIVFGSGPSRFSPRTGDE